MSYWALLRTFLLTQLKGHLPWKAVLVAVDLAPVSWGHVVTMSVSERSC